MSGWVRRAVMLVVLAVAASGLAAAARQPPQPPVKKGYIVARVRVSDPTQYAAYAKLSPDIVRKYGGRFLVRGGRVVTLEGPEVTDRIVIAEFPGVEQARRFYESPEYAAARRVRAGAAEASFVLLEEYVP